MITARLNVITTDRMNESISPETGRAVTKRINNFESGVWLSTDNCEVCSNKI